MDQREYVVDWEETIRTAFAGLMAGHWHAMPGRVTQDSTDGHTVQVQATVKRVVTDPVTGDRSYEDHPVHPDVPVKFASGGGMTHTFPLQEGLEGLIAYVNRDHNGWHQNGDTQNPVTDRMHGYADPIFIPGLRSDPRKLQAVSTTSSQIRSDDGRHVTDHDPLGGITHFSADPATAIASAGFNPFKQATAFFRHAIQGASGILGQAVSGSIVHDHGITHADGPFMRCANALHAVLCHPTNGASLNAQNLLHSVTAGPLGSIMSAFGGKHTVSALASGLSLQSAAGIALQCPAGGLSLPSGGVSAGALASGAASSNVGALWGDLSGELPDPQVTALHVDFSQYPAATSDATAAAAGVIVGGLYRDTSVAAGKSYLAVRTS